MSVEKILSYVRQKGVILIADGDRINYRAPFGIMTPEIVEGIKTHRNEIVGILKKESERVSLSALTGPRDTLNILPGNCDTCPAAGYWDYIGPGKWCFHRAYFLGKPGDPVHCDTAKSKCPLTV